MLFRSWILIFSAWLTANVIAQDLTDAQTLNVAMTPVYFVNGKPLPSFGIEQLKGLVDQALSDSRTK